MSIEIEQVNAKEAEGVLSDLVAILVNCVNESIGTSISFYPPLAPARAETFWRGKFADIEKGQRILLVARSKELNRIVGTVMLELMWMDNQPHRGEVQKLLVDPEFRRAGVARTLMEAIEKAAFAAGRTLLVLDTVKGSPASNLYRRLGWQEVGEIPFFTLNPDGVYESTVIFYKNLRNHPRTRRNKPD